MDNRKIGSGERLKPEDHPVTDEEQLADSPVMFENWHGVNDDCRQVLVEFPSFPRMRGPIITGNQSSVHKKEPDSYF